MDVFGKLAALALSSVVIGAVGTMAVLLGRGEGVPSANQTEEPARYDPFDIVGGRVYRDSLYAAADQKPELSPRSSGETLRLLWMPSFRDVLIVRVDCANRCLVSSVSIAADLMSGEAAAVRKQFNGVLDTRVADKLRALSLAAPTWGYEISAQGPQVDGEVYILERSSPTGVLRWVLDGACGDTAECRQSGALVKELLHQSALAPNTKGYALASDT